MVELSHPVSSIPRLLTYLEHRDRKPLQGLPLESYIQSFRESYEVVTQRQPPLSAMAFQQLSLSLCLGLKVTAPTE